ncbi:MAG: radical SAM protein [Candidatus Gottesmanbacteria bacterium]
MNKRVILVHPPMRLRSLYGPLAEAGSQLPPQGLCSLAAVLRADGYEPIIIDATAENLNFLETYERIIKELPAIFVGFTVYFVSEPVVAALARKLKKKFPEVKIVVGGGQATLLKDKMLENYHDIDMVCISEGEKIVKNLTPALETNQSLRNIRGIVYREKEKIISNQAEEWITNLDILPFPAWDLLPPLAKYYLPAGDSLKRFPSTGLVTSRGCPGQCFFCHKNMFGTLVRQNSPDYVIRELEELQQKYGIRDIYFQDDTFTSHREWVIKFCQLLIKKNLDLTWACHGRTDLVDFEMLKLMKKAGCWQITFGIESGSQKVLDTINKQTTVEQNEKTLEICRQVGLSVKGLFMLGSFGETKDTINETKKFLKENYLTDFHMTFFTIYPGTVAYHIWPKFGRKSRKKTPISLYEPSFIPFGLTRDYLIKEHRNFYKAFYLRPVIIWNFIKKMSDYHQWRKIVGSGIAFFRYTFFTNLYSNT